MPTIARDAPLPTSTSFSVGATKILHSRPPIPALTGLRFFAAFFILWEHSIGWIAQFQNTDVSSYFGFLGVPGMSLFFVLSGFVIHYNYRDLFLRRQMLRSLCEFAAARFARLYPLYLVFLFVAVAANAIVVLGRHGIPIFAYYLTLTQSWWYVVFDGRLIINWVFPLSWSVSTEIFFYAAYPAVVLLIAPVASGRRMIWIAALYACLVLAVLTVAWTYLDDFLQFARGWVSDYIDPDTSVDNSFYRWFFYFSPYTRVLEFFLGCMMAQAIIQLATRPPTHRERQWGTCALAIALVLLLLVSLIETNTIEIPALSDYVQHLENSFLCAPPVAVILFCVARYETWFARFLSLPWLIVLGEMSYSIYLVHTWTLRLFIHPVRPLIWPQIVDVILCISCGIALTILLSYGTYNLIERPGRIWLRRSLAAAINVVFGRAATLAASGPTLLPKTRAKRLSFTVSATLALAFVSLSGQAIKSDRVVEYFHGLFARPGPEIVVVSASYGLNCPTGTSDPEAANLTPAGNATAKICELCRFTAFCVVQVGHSWLGDPAPGCAKDFDVTYQCGKGIKSAHIDGEASGKSVVLKCWSKSIDSER